MKQRCKMCDSTDLWRVADRSGIVAWIMRLREQKPYECRACGWSFYRRPGRASEAPPVGQALSAR
jgi:hypothetical protein